MSSADVKHNILSTVGSKTQFDAMVLAAFDEYHSELSGAKPVLALICSYVPWTKFYIVGGEHWSLSSYYGRSMMRSGPSLVVSGEMYDPYASGAVSSAGSSSSGSGDVKPVPRLQVLPEICNLSPLPAALGRGPTGWFRGSSVVLELNPDKKPGDPTGSPWLLALAGHIDGTGCTGDCFYFDTALLEGAKPGDSNVAAKAVLMTGDGSSFGPAAAARANATSTTVSNFPSGWSKLPKLPARIDFTVAAVGQILYAFGSQTDACIHRLNLTPGIDPTERMSWHSLDGKHTTKNRTQAKCVSPGDGCIYVVGGVWAGSGVRKCEVFDVKTESILPATTVADSPAALAHVISYDHGILGIAGDRSFWKLSLRKTTIDGVPNPSYRVWEQTLKNAAFPGCDAAHSVACLGIHSIDGALHAVVTSPFVTRTPGYHPEQHTTTSSAQLMRLERNNTTWTPVARFLHERDAYGAWVV